MIPKTLGRFEVVAELGRGAMGVVYKGIDPKIQRPVALKVLRFEQASPSQTDVQARERFLVEARAAGQLSHPNILTIYDAGEEGDMAYIAMEYLEGGNLQDMIEGNKFENYDQIIDIARQVADGLDNAHGKNIVHRDIKPANIMMANGRIPKIADFGLARLSDSTLTTTGTVLGTPSYMAPEQIRGRKVDGRADLFALGVIFYEMLTGEKPFGGESITSVIYRVVNEEPIPPRQLNMDLPPGINEFMNRAIAKDPSERFQTGSEFASALKTLQAGKALEALAGGANRTQILKPGDTTQTDRTAPPAADAPEGPAKKGNAPLIAGAVAGIAVVVGLIIMLAGGGKKTDEKPATDLPAPQAEKKAEAPAPPAPVAIEPKKEEPPAQAAAKPEAAGAVKTAAVESAPPAVKAEPRAEQVPAFAISVTSRPSDADVFMNGKQAGKTPYLNRKYKSKPFTLRLSLNGHEDYETKFVLDKDMKFDVELKKLEAKAAVAGPGGTKAQKEPEPGEKKEEATKAAEPKPAGEKQDESGLFTKIFNPRAAGNIGTLIVNAQAGDRVTVNNQAYTEFPIKLEDTPIGKYNVYIVRKGKKPFIKTVSLGKGETATVTPEFRD